MSLHAVITVDSDSPSDHLNNQIITDFRKRVAADLAGGTFGVHTKVEVTYPEVADDEAEREAEEATLEAAWQEAWQAGYDEANARRDEIEAEKAAEQKANVAVVEDIEEDDVIEPEVKAKPKGK